MARGRAGLTVHFGGPDRPPGALRDLLQARVDAVPAGGWIHFATYYLRDSGLVRALIRARERGVRVRVTLEGRPRLASANQAAVGQLSNEGGFGSDLRVLFHTPIPLGRGRWAQPHLHSKIYVFSHPVPLALIGSFNPSGGGVDGPDDPEVLRQIGDQDRGHNFLVETRDEPLVAGLATHSDWLHGSAHGLLERLSPRANQRLRSGGLEVWFHPRHDTTRWMRELRRLGPGCRVRGAVSHLNEGAVVRRLARLARRGVQVELIVHASLRRVPSRPANALLAAGVALRRYAHRESLPMHDKFLLIQSPQRRTLLFGSFNLTAHSRWLNHEVIAETGDPGLIEAFEGRFEELAADPALR